VGLTCSLREFDYGIDLTLHQITVRTHPATGRRRYVESGMPLDVQVKSTTRAIVRGSEVAYDLDRDAYEDLRNVQVCTPRILVLHVQPKPEQERLAVTPRGLLIRGRCYWMSLKGFPGVPNASRVRIRIPVGHVLTADSLKGIMRRVSAEERF
jgi:hypothetical protein